MEQTHENRLGVQPIPRLLCSMALPLITANLITALYNTVDGIYVARLSESALTATVLAYPAQLLMQSVASGTATGVNSLLSRRLGAQRSADANRVAAHGVVLSLIGYVIFLVLGLTLSGPFISLFSHNAELCEMATAYLTIVLAGSIGVFLTYSMGGMLEAVGHAGLCMIMSVVGAFINIILDPILIFGLCGMPVMGIAGAAVATVISQVVSAILGIVFNIRFNRDIHVDLSRFRFRGRDLVEIYQVGLPSILMQSMGSVMNVGMNKILISASETAVSVFGVYYKMQTFVFMPVFGITQAQSIIVGYNYGAKQPNRMRQVIRLSIIAGTIIMGAGTVIVQLWPELILALFSAGPEMMSMGVHALRITSLPFILSATCIILGDALTGMGIGYVSAINSFLRQLLVLLPLAYLLIRFAGISAIWYAFIGSEICSLCYTLLMFRRIWRRNVRTMEKA